MANCSMFELLYVFNTTALFFVAHKASIIDFGNRDLQILNAIRLPLAPKSILYVIWVLI